MIKTAKQVRGKIVSITIHAITKVCLLILFFMSVSWTTYSQCTPTISSSAGSICNGVGQTVGVYATFGGGSNFQWYGPSGLIPGATSSSINVSQSGTYYLMATRSFGCPNLASNSVVISAFPSSAISPLGNTSLCQGASVTLSVNSTQSGYTYQWLKDGGIIQGANGPTYPASQTGNYSVLFNNGPCTSNSISVTASPIINTTVSASNLGVLCGSGSVTLTATSGYSYYYWFNAAGSMIYSSSTGTFTTSTPGSYSVQIINQSCYANSSPVTVSVGSNTAPTLSGTFTACTGVAVNYYTEGGKGNYNWSLYGGGTIVGDPTASSIYVIWNGTGTKTISVYYGWCGSPSQPTYKNVTVDQTPAAPGMPTISPNTCGAKTLTRGNPPVGVTWYWRGNNPYNEEVWPGADSPTYVVTDESNLPFYIRARSNNADCWSGLTTISVPVVNPPAPAPASLTYCEWDNMSLSTTGYPAGGSLRWYNENDQLQYTGVTYPVNLTFGNHNYHVKSINSSGCEGTRYSVTTANVTNCDNQLNWTESIAYGLDANGNAIEVGHSKDYMDGFGNLLQSQTKNYTANQVLAAQPIYNSFNTPTASTLPAPINASEFSYRHKFVTNANRQRYTDSDFDQRTTTDLNTPGEVKNPNPVGNTDIGTLGWYYSNNNTIEPLTPTTSFPYSSSYTPEGPDPTISISAGPGDQYKMGSGHEGTGERQLLQSTELSDYISHRPQFVPNSTITYSGTIGYKYISTDPDGKKTMNFEDANGHALASAVITSATMNPPTYDYWNYNYYNDLGQLVASVPPNRIGGIGNLSFITTYKYDHLGRLIETTSPDEGTSQFVYSNDGKVRFSQNQIQRKASPKRFSYTNYDYLGQLVEAGEYTCSGTNPYVFEPHTTIVPAASSVLNIVDINIPQGSDIETITVSTYPAISQKIDNVRCTDYSFTKYNTAAMDFPAGDADHPQQNNLFGQVSKTQNANSITWYSYDEFGELEWSKQLIPDLGYKTVDYVNDRNGNTIQAIYQKNHPDKFYNYYTYDADQRLSKVETSLNDTIKTLQAQYYYYLHGPLKRVELASNLQGIDYTYTLQGDLKSINHMDVTNDPGADGTAGVHSSFSKDVFGLTLNYFDNDFASAGHNAGNISPPGSVNSFAGTIKSSGWFSPVDNNTGAMRAYNYTYDNLNQLQTAKWGNVTGTNGNYTTTLSASSAYKEGMGSVGYDKNGNIRSMVRNGKTGNSIANYSYAYEPNTNRVDKIYDGGAVLIDYTYDSIGRMTSYVEAGKTMNVSYNAYGLVTEVRNGSILVEKFVYDDRGDRVQKINYDSTGVLAKTTYYVHEVSGNVVATYEKKKTGSPVLIEVPIYGLDRLGEYKPANPSGHTTFYELDDNLGNVRAVIGAPYLEKFTATMEADSLTMRKEDKQFKNIAPRSQVPIAQPSPNHTSGGNRAIFVNNTRPIGPAIILKVSPGDVISIDTYAYYEGGKGYKTPVNSAILINAIISAFGGISGNPGDPGKIFNGLNNAFTGPLAGALAGSLNDTIPAAAVNMIMFDNNMKSDYTSLPMSSTPVSSAANHASEHLTIPPVTIPAPGYIYIYVNNNSNSANRVYFDDLTVKQLHSPFVAGGDYYPYGLSIEDRQIKIESYRFGYQGQHAEKDSVTGWSTFELRQYDARFGRWLSPDPYGQFNSPYLAMGNNPASSVDPDGGLCCDIIADLGISMEIALPKTSQIITTSAETTLENLPLHGFVEADQMRPLVAEPGAHMTTLDLDHVPAIRSVDTSPLTHLPAVDPSFSFSMPSAETIQTVAGFAGMIPGLNTVAGVIEAGAAFAAGDYWGAGFAVAGAIPLVGVAIKGAKLGILAMARLQKARKAGMKAHDAFYKIMKARGWAGNKGLRGLNGRLQIPDALAPGNRFWLELKPDTWSGRLAGKIKAARYKKQLGIHGRVVYYNPVTGDFVPF